MHDLVNMQSAGGFPLVYLQAAGSFPYGMLPLHDAFFTVAALVWGACWGSFLNVVIYRLPRGGSLIRPGSTCPSRRRNYRPGDTIWPSCLAFGTSWER